MDFPPFAFQKDGELTGVGKDIADGMSNLCPNLEIKVVQVDWEDCWTAADGGKLGQKVANGTLDGCMTYTHARGRRDELAEFSDAILKTNPAGLLTLLDEDGHPKVDGMDDLDGRTIIDVGGWAPTKDTFKYVYNKCTFEKYSENVNLVVATGDSPNDVAMEMLRRGEGDAIFIYANQATNFADCDENSAWNCSLWEDFGSGFAYVQSGQMSYTVNGTTLALSRPGSGIREKLRPCLQEFMQTKDYYEICKKYEITNQCFPNKYFSEDIASRNPYQLETHEHTGDCSDGFCSCDVRAVPMDESGAVMSSSALAAWVFFIASTTMVIAAVF